MSGWQTPTSSGGDFFQHSAAGTGRTVRELSSPYCCCTHLVAPANIKIIDVGQFLGAFAKLRKATISVVMSFSLPAWNNSAPNGHILMNLDI
jgi:hypothetical protein